jgi:hypothetical protein
MLLDAYENADTSSEMVNAAKELGKLHGLYAPEQTVTIQGTFEEAQKQITSMSNDDLLRIINDTSDVIEGELIDG